MVIAFGDRVCRVDDRSRCRACPRCCSRRGSGSTGDDRSLVGNGFAGRQARRDLTSPIGTEYLSIPRTGEA